MVRTKARLTVALLPVLLVLALVGCTKKGAAGSAAAANGGPVATAKANPSRAGGSGAAGTVRLKPVHPTGGQATTGPGQGTRNAAGAGSIPQGTDRLLTLRGGNPVYPYDYDIGALQPQLPAGTERGAIIRVVQEFFRGLTAGKIETRLLSPEWKDEIVRLLNEPLKKGELPESVRIGILSVEQDKAHAPIRMEKGSGSASGEIYLERLGDRWYVSDIQVSFADLEKPTVRSAPFDPAEWKSLIKE